MHNLHPKNYSKIIDLYERTIQGLDLLNSYNIIATYIRSYIANKLLYCFFVASSYRGCYTSLWILSELKYAIS